MKAVVLFLLRLATGFFLFFSVFLAVFSQQDAIIQAVMRLMAFEPGTYKGELIGASLGVMLLGLLIVLGVFRLPAYLLSVLVLLPGSVLAVLSPDSLEGIWIAALFALPLGAVATLAAYRHDDRYSLAFLIFENRKRHRRTSQYQSTDRLDFPDDPHDLIELPENTMRTEVATEPRLSDTQTTNDELAEKAAVDLPAPTSEDAPVEEAPQPKRKPNLPAVHSWH